MALASVGNLHPPSPSFGPSGRSSADFASSQEALLSGQGDASGSGRATVGSVPHAPPQLERVVAENPTQAINRPLVSLTPKVISRDYAETHPEFDDLKYWPTILQPKAVVLLVLLYTATAMAIGLLMWKTITSSDHNFRLSSENVRMISRYFPSIIGTVTVLIFRQTVREALRMEPYTRMADQKRQQAIGTSPAEGVGGAWFPWQSITMTPSSLLSITSLAWQFMVSFVVSLKVTLLASKEGIDETKNEHYWVLTVRLYPAGLLIIIYLMMIFHTLFICFHFHKKSTGLKWDPVSIADYASLFAHCNALEYIHPLELRHGLRPEHVMVENRLFRLGYWARVRDNPRETDVVYGIGVGFNAYTEDGQTPQVERDPLGRPWHHKLLRRESKKKPTSIEDCKKSGQCAYGTWPNCEHYPYKENPGCPRWLILLASVFPIAGLALSIYALAIRLPMNGFLLDNNLRLPGKITWNAGHNDHTLPPIDPADPNSNVLVWALLFRAVPTYIAGIFTSTIVAWIDLNMRFMQPFRNMFGQGPPKTTLRRLGDFFGWRHRSGVRVSEDDIDHMDFKPAKAADSILLAYITISPLQVPLTAWDKGHFKVCIYSTLNTLSPLFPIFVGALLTIALDQETKKVQFTFSLSAYIGVMVFLAVYSILLPAAIPGAYRLLPRELYSLADLMALCHESKFMASPHLNIADRNRTPSKEHMEARILLTDDHFLFGVYKGRDSREHIGFDITQQRENDFGKIKIIPNSVRHIPPEGIVERVKRSMTFAAEEGRKRVKAMTGSMTTGGTYSLSQRARGVHEQEEHEMQPVAESSGSQRRIDENAGRTRFAIPRKPVDPVATNA